MDARSYMQEFARTLSRAFFPDTVAVSWLRAKIAERRATALDLKAARNALFYGTKPAPCLQPGGDGFPVSAGLLHGLLGADGEAAELLELAVADLPDDELRRRVVEESGDLIYFAALALQAVGSDLEEAMGANIEKLRRRHPGGFDGARYAAPSSGGSVAPG